MGANIFSGEMQDVERINDAFLVVKVHRSCLQRKNLTAAFGARAHKRSRKFRMSLILSVAGMQGCRPLARTLLVIAFTASYILGKAMFFEIGVADEVFCLSFICPAGHMGG